jgi:hypothetical protein
MGVRKHTVINFATCGQPSACTNAVGQIAVVTDQATNFVRAGRHTLEVYNDSQNDLILPLLTMDANCTNGYAFNIDAADNDGYEVTLGVTADNTLPYAFKVGTDPAFFLKVKLGIPDVSEFDVVTVGFRKAAAMADCASAAAAITAYTDCGGFNVNAGDIYSITRLNNGTGTATDTTDNWADDAVKELGVFVSSAGVLSLTIDGAAPTVNTNTLTFDTGDVLIPYIHVTRDENGDTDIPIINRIICGYQ